MIFFFLFFFFGIGIGRLGVMGNKVRKGKREKEKEFMANRRVPWIDVDLGLPTLSYLTLLVVRIRHILLLSIPKTKPIIMTEKVGGSHYWTIISDS